MSADWWARKLGRAPERPDSRLPYPAGPPQAPQPPAWGEQQPGGPPPAWVFDAQSGAKKLNTMAWEGGRATKTETMRCPNCGSANFFSRSQGHSGERLGIINQHGQHCAPAPQCAECSYNGQFMVFGGG